MIVRPERYEDYPVIAEINARAFGRGTEAAIVALMRQYPSFDRELSLVAEEDGILVGHVLFTPWTIRLLGADVSAVNLAPIAVSPDVQRRGIGTALINEGHRVAREKGHAVSFLLGHDTYYPRFGYRTHAYGVSSATLPIADLTHTPLETRVPTGHDVAKLRALWRSQESGVDFAIDPGPGLIAWTTPAQTVRVHVYIDAGTVVGYTRAHQDRPHEPAVFLARDIAAAQQMAATLAASVNPSITELTVPVHPRSACATAFPSPSVTPWNAAMACSLMGDSIERYFDQVATGYPVGRVTWPTAFDL